MSPLPAVDSGSRDPGSYETLEHELRTPLASLRSIAEILRDYPDLDDDQRRSFLESMIAENERLSRTVDRLLAWIDDRAVPLS
jgi:signal transduction histidine kinase